eukprot:TRINITY_DN15264_c0_g1_i2.p1 TRINITY_DN15264_c0_g1~~TRINITY_DN15264_c0_g1_i2.p1  ORF type:complete len:125 (+),score=25.27 TRINITY_DN15264_c0_g1_i2:39-413(+)
MCRFCVNGLPGQDFDMFGGRDSMYGGLQGTSGRNVCGPSSRSVAPARTKPAVNLSAIKLPGAQTPAESPETSGTETKTVSAVTPEVTAEDIAVLTAKLETTELVDKSGAEEKTTGATDEKTEVC